jgi:hypothetical protein
MLYGLANLREHVFNMGVHQVLSPVHTLLAFKKNFGDEILILNHHLNHFCREIVPFDEIYHDVVRKRKVFEQIRFEDAADKGYLRNFTHEFQETIRDDVRLDEVPVLQRLLFVV